MSLDFDRLALISLGSNQGDSDQILRAALGRLQTWSSQPLLRSSIWSSEPMDCPPGSPWFLNAAAGLVASPAETPESMLDKLQALEREFGRRAKMVRNEPRPLDLDLIAMGREIRQTPSLILPHPRATNRLFVLRPLAEIVPDFVLPGQTSTISMLASVLGETQAVTKVAL